MTTPPSTQDRKIPFICGIDETGRGPVLGPMLYTIGYCPLETQIPSLYKKINDSKKLTKAQREMIFQQMKADEQCNADNTMQFETIVTTSREITHKMLKRQKYNLNLISHDCALNLVEKVEQILKERANGSYISELYVDTVGTPATYKAKFEKRFPFIDKIVVESKADANYPIVSAASIVAKVLRDGMIEDMEKILGAEITGLKQPAESTKDMSQQQPVTLGSGYPSDPKTKQFLSKHFDSVFAFDPEYVRLSWGTVKDLIKEKGISVEWSDDEEEGNDTRKRKRSFGSSSSSGSKKKAKTLFSFALSDSKNQRCRFLRDLEYSTVEEF